MLIKIVGEGLSSAEEKFVTRLRDAGGDIPGLALINVHVPAASSSRARQVDAIVICRSAIAVGEIKGFFAPQHGTLSISRNSSWTVAGAQAALHHLRSENPYQQARNAALATKNALTADGLAPGFVTAAVWLFPLGPWRSLQVDALADTSVPTIAKATTSALQQWLTRLDACTRPTFSADDVRAMLRALDCADVLPDLSDLRSIGFSGAIVSAPHTTTVTAPAPFTPPPPVELPAVVAPAPVPAAAPITAPDDPPPALPPRLPPPPAPLAYRAPAPATMSWPYSPPYRRRRWPRRLGLFCAVVLAIVTIGMAAMAGIKLATSSDSSPETIAVERSASTSNCAATAYGAAVAYFTTHRCTALRRQLLHVPDPDVWIVTSRITMPTAAAARATQRYLLTGGTGDITPLAKPGQRFSGSYYGCASKGTVVACAAAENGGQRRTATQLREYAHQAATRAVAG